MIENILKIYLQKKHKDININTGLSNYFGRLFSAYILEYIQKINYIIFK